MESVFLRNEDGVEMEQPAAVEDYFVARGWVVFDPAHEAALAKVAADAAKAIADHAKAAELAAATVAAAVAAADAAAEATKTDDAAATTEATATGLTQPAK